MKYVIYCLIVASRRWANIFDLIILFFLQNWPESFVVILFCYAVLAVKPDYKKIALLAVVQGLVNYVSLLPMSFGFHTAILTVTLIIIIHLSARVSLPQTTLAALTCLLVFITVEPLINPVLLKITGKEYLESYNNPWLRSAFSLPTEGIFLLLALLRYQLLGRKLNNDR